jgi:hypothetical protein
MTPRIPLFIALCSFSLSGCVAALPMAAQLMTSPDARAKLCSFAKLPGHNESICDGIPLASAAPTPTPAKVTAR